MTVFVDVKKLAALIGGAVIVVAAATPSFAVKTDVDGYFYDLPDGATKNLAALRVLIEASEGMGLTRNNGQALNCIGCTLPSFQLVGTGTYGGVEKATVKIDFDYRYKAIRADITGPDKKRSVIVSANGQAWDESTPGIFAKAATQSAQERLIPVYLYPSAPIYFGGAAPDKVKLTTDGGARILTVPIPDLNTEIKATVNAKGQVTKTEMAFGGKTYTGEYSQFDNDRVDNHIFLPNRIVQKVNGTVLTDLTLEYHWGNAYMIFRTPKELASK